MDCNATSNIVCDDRASKAHFLANPSHPDPLVPPTKKWVSYATKPYTHKLLGHFTEDVHTSLSYDTPAAYLASTVKLIHNWTPTQDFLFLQGPTKSPHCPRCSRAKETHQHIIECVNRDAINARSASLKSFLTAMVQVHTPIQILAAMEYKLSLTLNVPYQHTYSCPTALPSDSHSHFIIQKFSGTSPPTRPLRDRWYLRQHSQPCIAFPKTIKNPLINPPTTIHTDLTEMVSVTRTPIKSNQTSTRLFF